ncbi:MAG: hypothetical protein IKA82_00240 [Clostridia bacterium]|nr:hypothetical protein [Clostridia bacterium]
MSPLKDCLNPSALIKKRSAPIAGQEGNNTEENIWQETFAPKICDRITREVEGINRVFMDISPKPIGTIEFEQTLEGRQ